MIDAVDKLEIEPFLNDNSYSISTEDLKETNKKYENHPSIIKINENVRNGNDFTFKEMTNFDFEREILKLDPKKANLQGDIPVKMLIKTYDIISNYLSEYYNKAKQEHKYPTSLKIADVIHHHHHHHSFIIIVFKSIIIPIYKKDGKTLAKNYRPVSLIPVVSKLFERNMHTEIIDFIENSLSPFLFGFRKGHSTEQ